MKNAMMFAMGVLLLSSCSMMGMGMKDSSKDMAMKDTSMSSGAMKDSTMADGSMKDGAMKDTTMADGAMKDGAVMQGTASYSLGRQPAATNITPMGNVAVSMSGDMVMSTVKLTGLLPNTYYVAHYHNQGTASTTDPCASNGQAILASKIVGMTDAGGMLSMSGSVAKSAVLQATYFNVHTAKDAEGTPADAGVACSAVKM